LNESKQQHTVVIGAGIVGVCCATYLQRQGCAVTLVDRLPPGEACSFGNAGSLSPGSCVPNPMPGNLAKVPGWLLSGDGPLTIRWRYLPKLMPWLIGFIRAGTPARVEAAADALATLHSPTLELYQELARQAGISDLVRPSDYLFVFGSEASYASSSYGWQLRRARGARFDELSAAELRELEPDLSRHYVRGVLLHDQGYTLNPSRLVKALAAQAAREGVEILQDEVSGFDGTAGHVQAVRTAGRTIHAANVVIAGGAWSRRLTAKLGLRIPLDTERGYHATVANAGVRVGRPIMEGDYKFLATPMEMGVRFAGMVELAGVDAPMSQRRADTIVRLARRMFPAVETTEVSQWMGRRPSMPDGLPVIGRSPAHDNVYLAFGHGHTGMIGSPMTGRIIAGLVTGQRPNIDVSPFRADRF
jgi:D-amino-acid dehydrogenase